MPKIRAYVRTDNAALTTALVRYWEQDPQLHFRFRVPTLCGPLAMTARDFLAAVRKFTIAFVPDWNCCRCNKPISVDSRSEYVAWRNRSSRTDMLPLYSCRECRDAVRADGARSFRETLTRLIRPRPLPSRAIADYSLVAMVYLLSLIEYQRVEQCHRLPSLDERRLRLPEKSSRLAPTREMEIRMLRYLWNVRILTVSATSDVECFEWDLDGFPVLFRPSDAQWWLGDSSDDAMLLCANMQAAVTGRDWPLGWFEQASQVWTNIVTEEGIEFLSYALSIHGLPCVPVGSVRDKIRALARNVSLGQVWNLLWKATEDATHSARSGASTPTQAVARIATELGRLTQRFRSGLPDICVFERNTAIPQSILSNYFFNATFGVGPALPSLSDLQRDRYISRRQDLLPEEGSIPVGTIVRYCSPRGMRIKGIVTKQHVSSWGQINAYDIETRYYHFVEQRIPARPLHRQNPGAVAGARRNSVHA